MNSEHATIPLSERLPSLPRNISLETLIVLKIYSRDTVFLVSPSHYSFSTRLETWLASGDPLPQLLMDPQRRVLISVELLLFR
jgi:hypothetical protein